MLCVRQAKELSQLTGAQILLVVTSETGNMYEFATPKFNKVLETFKTWYRASAKDAKRVEVVLPVLPLLPMQVRHAHGRHDDAFWRHAPALQQSLAGAWGARRISRGV